MKKRSFGLQRVVVTVVALAVAGSIPRLALANSGFGVNTDINGNVINVPTYFADSPSGVHPAFNPATHTYFTTTFTTSAPSTLATGATTSVSLSVLPPITEAGASVDATGLIVTVGSTANLVAGDAVFGGGFPTGTKIVSVTSATSFTTTTASATPSVSGQSLWIIPNPGTTLAASATIGTTTSTVSAASSFVPVVGALVAGGGFPVGTTVTGITTLPVTVDTGAAMRKFVSPLGGVYNGLEALASQTDLQGGIPVALAQHKWFNPFNGVQTADDYYEIAVVEYTQQMHADLPKATRLRGYVQIETPAIAAGLKDITGVVGSEHIAGTYPDGSPILDSTGKQVYFVHKPHYLGPTIIVMHGTPVRIKYTNYLPYTDATGKSVGSWNGTGGETPLPIDETIPGGGAVLDSTGAQIYAKNAAGQPILDSAGNPVPVKMGQNRVSVHWHGGDTPWTNDGTPHQWFAPAGDIAYTLGVDARHPYGMGRGESTTGQSVADMPDPGAGSYNLYFPNQVLTGRLMMYHDHASGLTRPNAYIGEAAGYIVVDATELGLASSMIGEPLSQMGTGATAGLPTGLLDAVGIPLVIQDKGFVPKNIGPAAPIAVGSAAFTTPSAPVAVASDGTTPASQDARWNLSHWGQPGDLYFPHVYETNQDPNSIDGTNPVGRWDWGPWFWPVFPAQYSLPTGMYGDVTTTPEAFMHTPIVNGSAFPVLTVDPKTYRFRILSIANDRSFNLGLYQAVDANGVVCDQNNTSPALPPTIPGGLPPAACTEVRMVPASPNPGFPANWPTDGRAGGVPDPSTAGPSIVQIGNEAGLLPQVAVWNSQPLVYEQNVRSITVFNVLQHDLLLMGAERVDAFIDFTNYAGQTLILYNDAPAPLPGFDPRLDMYTGDGDQTPGGGTYNTMAGYAPNTRTVLQIKVNATNSSGTGGPLNLAALQTALPVAYAATQPAPIIPEKVYDAAFGTTSQDNYATIGTGSNAKPTFFINGNTSLILTGLVVRAGGLGYAPGTTVTFSAPQLAGGVTATATPIFNARGVLTGFSAFNPGSGYTQAPTISFSSPPGADGLAALVDVQASNGYSVINKAIQELFDPVFGRMNATLAVELPFSSATVATTIPLAYIDTPVEYFDAIKEGETQIWKITHNGVDSHPVHFHLVNVQVINRVGWDGVIKPPGPAEVGWRETLRMNPLEDVYVAVRAAKPVTPYGLPASQRLMDPSIAVGSTLGITQIDPFTGNAPTSQTYINAAGVNGTWSTATYTNQLTNFDNEYVWHCHILGHEEFDFMRPFIFHPNVIVPDAPGTVTTNGATVTWVDPTPYGGQDAQGIPTAGVNAAYPTPTASPKNEIGFHIWNAAGALAGTAVANATTFTDPAGAFGPYTVTAFNAAGESVAGTSTTKNSGTSTVTAPTPTQAPGTQAATAAIDATGLIVTLNPAPTTPLVVGASVSGGGFPAGTTIASITSATVFTASKASTTPGVSGVTLTISLAAAAPLPQPTAPAAPANLTQTLTSTGAVTLAWTPVPGATSYTVTIVETTSASVVNTTTATVLPVAPATTPAATFTTAVLNAASTYTFSVTATNLSGTSPASSTSTLTNSPTAAPVAFAGAADTTPTNITLTWANSAANKNNVAGLLLTWTTGGATVSHTFAPTTTGVTLTGLTSTATYTFTLQAVSNVAAFNSPVLSTFATGVAATVVAP